MPYHNAESAALICHHTCVLLELKGVRKQLGGIDRLAVIVAALGHKVSHFGFSDAFLVKTRHELAR